MSESILSHLTLSDEQRQAALQAGCDTAVLAGAGCGKTGTLVARYLHLLEQGLAPEEVVAITFTDRAGLEMRGRIRSHLRDHVAAAPADRQLWLERYMALDAAPIGTIHSFCSRLLRAHPAEAALDPGFDVLDESQAAALQADAVERALAWAVGQPLTVPCFPLFGGPSGLRDTLASMVARRLEVAEALAGSGEDVLARWQEAAHRWLREVLHEPAWEADLVALEEMVPLQPGDPLDVRRLAAVAAVRAARRAAVAGDWGAALASLAEGVRRPGNAGSRAKWGDLAPQVRAALRQLCGRNEEVLKIAREADPALDAELAAAWPGLEALFRQALQEYGTLKGRRQEVDFDDLESGALRLLRENPEVAAYVRGRYKAVLVDEFQDTNDRQRRLIEALLGAAPGQVGRLFIVGDAKQSIYRFRGADVTVFRQVEQEIARAGGRIHHLDRTYRAHAGLVGVLNDLLAAVLGDGEGDARLYRVPSAPLRAATGRAPRLAAPFLELHLGVAERAEEGRAVAAAALAARLRRLQREEGVGWGEIACLFRAMTNSPVYEEAFERASIPYVTVAGAGFLARPEVRDLLNALRAVSNLTDDLALAGLLRSPAIGLRDATLYLLRWGPEGAPRPLWTALQGDLSALEAAERERAVRAREIIAEVAGLAGRQTVAAVLKRLLDLTGYRAILQLCPQTERAGRNVDKLLADAHRSGLVGVGDFLAHVQLLSDTAAREGEAPPEAGEAVQLMSVHKAKGLEFGVVVIADAGHSGQAGAPAMLVHPEWGLLLRVSRAEGSDRRTGLVHRLGGRQEEEMQDAEERRLLYVAATRAREKLLISGHARQRKEALGPQGWVKRLLAALGDEALDRCQAPAPGQVLSFSCWEDRVACLCYGEGTAVAEEDAVQPSPAQEPDVVAAAGLPARLARPYVSAAADAEAGEVTPDRVWRVIPAGQEKRAPRWVVGKLVHAGLRLWRFAPEPALLAALDAAARGAGLTDRAQVESARRAALDLLARFGASELCRELDAASERRHELPFIAGPSTGGAGRVDLLCRLADGSWCLVDIKTHHLRTRARFEAAIRQYEPQVRRYGRAVRAFLGVEPRLLLCFLDYQGAVHVHQV